MRSSKQLLHYLVTETLEARGDNLTTDSIARRLRNNKDNISQQDRDRTEVAAALLREQLASYYADAGLADEVLIELPAQAYQPVFAYRELSPAEIAATIPATTAQNSSLSHRGLYAAILALLALAAFLFLA